MLNGAGDKRASLIKRAEKQVRFLMEYYISHVYSKSLGLSLFIRCVNHQISGMIYPLVTVISGSLDIDIRKFIYPN